MAWRVFRFFLFQLAGGLLGYWFWPTAQRAPGIIVGIVFASALWVVLDLRRSRKLLAWLREGDTSQPPSVPGYWGEVAERSRRLIRSRDRLVQQSELRLQEFLAAIQASPNGVVLLDPDGRIEWLNQTAAEHFGFDPERDLLQLIGNLVRDPLFVAYLAEGDFTHEAIMHGPASASSRPVRLSVQLHRYGEGRKLLLSRDVTVLQQAEAMRRDFVANVSHEIRTPLTVLSGFVESMQNLPMEAAERQLYLGFMAQQALRMQTLVNDLLTLSRLEGSPPPGKDEWIDVRGLIAQCEQEGRDLSMLMAKMGHEVRVDISVDSELAGSQVELHSAMANLVNNAIRYTPTAGKVVLGWAMLPDGSGEFSVTDTGPGIDPEHVPRLTERFYRIDRSRSRETGGTGLGLAIVKHVAQRHDAQLHIDSKPGQGSRFAIAFPPKRVRTVAAAAKA